MKLRSTSMSAAALLLIPLTITTACWVPDASARKAPWVYYRNKDGNSDIQDMDRVHAIRPPSVAAIGSGGVISIGKGVSYHSDISKRAKTALEQETDDRRDDCNERKGNPVVLYTGNKVEIERDFTVNGEMGLYLERTYNHHWSAAGLFGNHWISNFDYSLAFSNAQKTAWAQRPDGRRIKLIWNEAQARWNEDRAKPVAYLVKNSDGSFTLNNEELGSERYNADGYITELRNEQGVYWSFAYTNKYLQSVTHSSGRSIQFTWSNGLLTQVKDPAGNVYQYGYTADVFGAGRARLASATLPGAPQTTITYHYEDARYPGGFTGKSYNGVRYSTFAYDAYKRATLSEHAGGIERHTFSYAVESSAPVAAPPAPVRPGGVRGSEETGWCEYNPRQGQICIQPRSLPGGSIQLAARNGAQDTFELAAADDRTRPVKLKVSETNPLGRTTTYAYEDGRQVSVTGTRSSTCPASYKEQTYDANGNPDIVHDFVDNITDFDYSPEGNLLKKVEAAGSSAEQATLYQWDAAGRHLLKETRVGDSETTFTYDGRGNVSSATKRNLTSVGVNGQARTTQYTYTYHANGLTASVKEDGPLAQDDVTSTFDAKGDLTSITNALGHKVTYSAYNELGLPGRITGANGDVRETTYDARGRVLTDRINTGSGWATTTTTYTAAGDVASVTTPVGIRTQYSYDAGRRLLSEVYPLGNGNWSWTRYSYDVASNRTRTETAVADYSVDSVVKGVVDEINHDAQWNWFVRGWACATGSRSSIPVDAYVHGGAFIAGAQANLASEPGVATECGTNGASYRFQIPLTVANRQQLGGRTVAVYGISPLGSAHNRLLSNSGVHAIPSANVIGDIAGVMQDAGWNYTAEGWACSVGVDASIDVHLYAGGAAGRGGTFVAAARANRASDANVANACQAKGRAYYFSIPLDAGMRAAHGGKSIHIHGISPAGGPNLTINRSGAFSIPAIARTADLVNASASPSHIFNGQSSTVTFQFRNTGNVIWMPGETHMVLRTVRTSEAIGLSTAVAPGSVATFTVNVAPVNSGSGVAGFEYLGQLASGPNAWGPQGQVIVRAENDKGSCNPKFCEEPR
ncbi:DUF6531 domain-containing protein [Stenotrophomonas maltophilia]|uniref:DUF6531 domain-containing protein n=1 Tax=Stenotrophomonas maltophilia TaxID=40324 RepID=UPI003916F5B3